MGRSAVLVAERCYLFLLTLLLSWLRLCTCDGWDQSLVLDNDGKFLVHWSLEDDKTIKFMVEVETQGYVGFGLSMTGGMAGSDIVTGWIDNGIVAFQDRHGLGNFIPEIDDSQDWELLSGNKNGTHTVMTFRRKLDTCDKEQDIVIDKNRIRLIYAYSEDAPKSPEELQYHQGRRGVKTAGLLEPPSKAVPHEKKIYYWDALTSSFNLTSDVKSVYWCTIVKGPELQNKHHIIKYEPLTSPPGNPYLHHVLVYECVDSDVHPAKYEEYVKQGGFQCTSAVYELENAGTCWAYLCSWAVGTEEVTYLSHTGLPLKARPPKYYRIEVHYENPSGTDNLRVQSGLRFWYTPELREHDVGMLMIGAHVSPLMVIPPAQNSYVIAGHGYSECLASALPPEGANITGAGLHAHALGRRLLVRHFRGSKELRPILRNDHYDFNYQQKGHLPEEVSLLPGDHVVVECTYDSSMRSSPTFGGRHASEEMCLAYLTYYPQINREAIRSVPTAPLLFGLTGLDGYRPNMTDDELRRRLETVDWSKVNISLMETATKYSPHESYCSTESGVIRDTKNLVTYPKNYVPYREKDECSQRKSKLGVSAGTHNRLTFLSFVFTCTLILYSCKSEVH